MCIRDRVRDIRDLVATESLDYVLRVSHVGSGAQSVAQVVARSKREDGEGGHFVVTYCITCPEALNTQPFFPSDAMY